MRSLLGALALSLLPGLSTAQAPAPPAPSTHAHAGGWKMPDARMFADLQNMSDELQIELQPMLDGMHGPLSADLKLPHGTWWRDVELTKRIGLSGDQQKRIEDLFLQNKIQLIHLHASLQEQELLLQPALDANPPDQNKALTQISMIADTRAELEKANAKMLLGIRGVLTGDQWTKLQAERSSQQERSRREMREMIDRARHGQEMMMKPRSIPPAPKPDGSLVMPPMPNMPPMPPISGAEEEQSL